MCECTTHEGQKEDRYLPLRAPKAVLLVKGSILEDFVEKSNWYFLTIEATVTWEANVAME